MALLGIQINGLQNVTYFKFSTPISLLNKKGANFSPFFPKLMGSGIHCSKIDGFPGTHGTNGTYANGATAARE